MPGFVTIGGGESVLVDRKIGDRRDPDIDNGDGSKEGDTLTVVITGAKADGTGDVDETYELKIPKNSDNLLVQARWGGAMAAAN